MANRTDLYEKLSASIKSHTEVHPASPFSEQFISIDNEMESAYYEWLSEIKRRAMIDASENDDDMPG